MSRFPTSSLVTAAVLGSLSLLAGSADAQCGAAVSSCRQCHELNEPKTLRGGDAWHADHAFADLCSTCHGGDPSSSDVGVAHVGIVDPFANHGERCGGCHTNKEAVVAGYLRRRSLTPPERAPSSPPRPSSKIESLGREGRATSSSSANVALSVAASTIALLGGLFVAKDRKRRRVSERTPHSFRDAEWSPYVAGALLGLVVAVSMALFGHRLSGGGAYQYVGAVIGRALTPRSVFFRYVIPARADWELVMVSGALLGAFFAARASGTFRIRTMPDSGWQGVFGSSIPVRWAIAFLGAALTEFAAGIAGGCTASLAVSGGAALAPGAFAFVFGMFAGGVPTAWFVYRGSKS